MPQPQQVQAVAVHHKKKSQSLAQGDWLFFPGSLQLVTGKVAGV
jgi:hypothetical protein